MTSLPLVSVVVPTFNRARLLPAAIESALAQTWKNLEVLVVDDGSSDDTPDIVDALYRRDARVRPFRQRNQGVSAARNRALAEAQGSFIAFLDSDDVWQPWKLDLQMQLFRAQPQLVMCWTDMAAIDEAGRPVLPRYLRRMYSAYERLADGHPFAELRKLEELVPEAPAHLHGAGCGLGDIYGTMLYGNLVHTSTAVLRREVVRQIGGFDETMRRGGEDYKFHLATCRHGATALLDVPSILYRVGAEDRITHPRNNVHFARSYLRTVEGELREFRSRLALSNREINSILSEAHRWLAETELDDRHRSRAGWHALQAMWRAGSPQPGLRPLGKALLPESVVNMVRRWKGRALQTPATLAVAASAVDGARP